MINKWALASVLLCMWDFVKWPYYFLMEAVPWNPKVQQEYQDSVQSVDWKISFVVTCSRKNTWRTYWAESLQHSKLNWDLAKSEQVSSIKCSAIGDGANKTIICITGCTYTVMVPFSITLAVASWSCLGMDHGWLASSYYEGERNHLDIRFGRLSKLAVTWSRQLPCDLRSCGLTVCRFMGT